MGRTMRRLTAFVLGIMMSAAVILTVPGTRDAALAAPAQEDESDNTGKLEIRVTISRDVTLDEARDAITVLVKKMNADESVSSFLSETGAEREDELAVSLDSFNYAGIDEYGNKVFTITYSRLQANGVYYEVVMQDRDIPGYLFVESQSKTKMSNPIGNSGKAEINLKGVYKPCGNLTVTKKISGKIKPEEAEGVIEMAVQKLDDYNEVEGYLDEEGRIVDHAVRLTLADFDDLQTDEDGYLTAAVKRYSGIPAGIYRVYETSYDITGHIFEAEQSVIEVEAYLEGHDDVNAEILNVYEEPPDEGVIYFFKYVYTSETCSADAQQTKPLKGAAFTAVNTQDETISKTAVSGENGLVEFETLPAGTYKIRETTAPDGAVPDGNVYIAVIRYGTCEGILNEQENAIAGNRIVNDVFRADIVIETVNKDDAGEKVDGAKYTLYRLTDGDPVKIATKEAGSDGKVVFDGLLAYASYRIEEASTPEGYEQSASPIEVGFKTTEDTSGNPKTVIDPAKFSDGEGTASLKEDGTISWLKTKTPTTPDQDETTTTDSTEENTTPDENQENTTPDENQEQHQNLDPSTPQTGDKLPLGWLIALLVISVVGVGVVIFLKKKNTR